MLPFLFLLAQSSLPPEVALAPATLLTETKEASQPKEELTRPLLVTVPPYLFLIGELVGDGLPVELVLPAGASPHTYEPTARQVDRLSRGRIWFTLGEPFEERAFRAMQAFSPDLERFDLRQGVDLIEDSHCHSHAGQAHSCADLHYWLSPKELNRQLSLLVPFLISHYPSLRSRIEQNGQRLQLELKQLDEQLASLLSQTDHPSRLMLVAHPAFGYFARDYGLEQLSIEQEGKEPSVRQLTQLLERAKAASTHKVFVLPQYPKKAAELIASQLGAELVQVDPYAKDYFGMMRQLGKELAQTPPTGKPQAPPLLPKASP